VQTVVVVVVVVVVIIGWRLLPESVHHGVDFVEAVGAREAWHGAEVALDAERVALTVEVRQRQHDRHQPRRRDYFHRPRLAREDFGVDRMDHRVESVHVHGHYLCLVLVLVLVLATKYLFPT